MLSYTSVVVYLVYLSIQMNPAKYYYCFTICMTTLEYIGKKYTVSKVPFSRKLGIWHTILINSPFIFEQYLGDSSLVGCLAQQPSFTPKTINNTIFAHKISHFTRLLSSQYREVLFVCTSNLAPHCVVTGVKVPPYGEIITAAQTPNCSHFTPTSGLFKHNCKPQASAIVYCVV